MKFSRRLFLASACAAGLPVRLIAQNELSVAEGTLSTLSDGHLVLPEGLVFAEDSDPAPLIAAAEALGLDPWAPPCNVTLWRSETETVLFDTGAGPDFMPTAGKLAETLGAAGIAPEDVTHVVFTHGHPDHLWGVLDDFDEPLFANARHFMGEIEHDYWTDPATSETIGEARLAFAAGASRRLGVLGDRIEPFADADELAPGIRALASFGHTPGHMSFETPAGLIVGDAIGNGHVAFARPNLASPADQQPGEGIATRLALLQRLAESGETLSGFHLPSGGIGTVRRESEAFRFEPENAS